VKIERLISKVEAREQMSNLPPLARLLSGVEARLLSGVEAFTSFLKEEIVRHARIINLHRLKVAQSISRSICIKLQRNQGLRGLFVWMLRFHSVITNIQFLSVYAFRIYQIIRKNNCKLNLLIKRLFFIFGGMVDLSNSKSRVRFFLAQMSSKMPEVIKQIKVYEKAIENNSLIEKPKPSPQFNNV
jgi:hypothetical protein